MYTEIFTIMALTITGLGGYAIYQRCIKEKIEYPIRITAILSIIILVILAYLVKTELSDYLKNTLFIEEDAIVSIVLIYTFLFISGLYVVLTLITEDLLKNTSTIFSLFSTKKSKKKIPFKKIDFKIGIIKISVEFEN